ncbi:G-protein coupled receptor Mth2-like isoform X3 [Wyeomyia smithii]|uniref:G-protein coupled receptor Mth2-like isoform X3 n=1 Tax=Wyeomyia smithii TaxID=174621 RepID=UPI002467C4BB|nr:G-protein coupled receptor Mth2-like isoform X3 [Wyeomyia smithii]
MPLVEIFFVLGLALSTQRWFFVKTESELPCDFSDSVNITDGTKTSDGKIEHEGIVYEPQSYGMFNYGYDTTGQKVVSNHIRGCVCRVKSCFYMCCSRKNIFYNSSYPSCRNEPLEVRVNVSDDLVDLANDLRFFKALRVPNCVATRAESNEWKMDRTGFVHSYGAVEIKQKKYCLYVDENEEIELYFCSEETSEITKISGIVLSIPFLVATLLIYVCIPELRNIHGKSLICYTLALTVTYIVLLFINFHSTVIPCSVLGYMLYFSVLVSFFWLNVMCIDIFWTFSSGVVMRNERKRFLYYSLYAFGSPVVILVLALIFDFTELVPEEYRPRFGEPSCFIHKNKWIEFVYFYLPLLILVVANLYFFVVTAIRIIRIQRATEAVLRNDSERHSKFEKDRNRYGLYLRLFIVMGITWTFEIISWAAESENWFFYVADICNCLLGVIIFFLFVWKQRVRQLVAKRIGNSQPLRHFKSSSSNAVTCSETTKFSSFQESNAPQQPGLAR